MENKEAEGRIFPLECPVCGSSTNYVYCIKDSENLESIWYRCCCGVIFQKDLPAHDVYNAKYIANYEDAKDIKRVAIHAGRTYAPIVEELTYGRKMLDVGFGLPYNMNFFKERGWITTGIEINEEYNDCKGIINGNFETYENFKEDYDFIWMSHALEHFNNPIEVLRKSYDLLSESGVIYLAVPDIDFIMKTGVANWGHFKKREHYVLWSERAIVRELEKIGFNVVVKKKNFSQRFITHYDCHIIAQKNFI